MINCLQSLQPSRVTGLQATSPKRSRAFSRQDIFSALESQGKSLSLPLRGRARRPPVPTAQRRHRYWRPQRFPRLLRSRSRAPPSGRGHSPSSIVFSVVSLPSFSLALLWVFLHHRLVPAFFVCCRPSSPFPKFKPHSPHTGSLLPTTAAVFTDHTFPAFCPYIKKKTVKASDTLEHQPVYSLASLVSRLRHQNEVRRT